MARGIETKEATDKFFKEFNECSNFIMQIIPCIIPANDEDKEILQRGLKTLRQINEFIDDCDGDLGELSELFNIDAIAEEYSVSDSKYSEDDDYE